MLRVSCLFRSFAKNHTSHVNAFFLPVGQDFGNFVHGILPVLSLFRLKVLEGFLAALQGRLVRVGLLCRVDPLFRGFDPGVVQIVLFPIPKVRD